MSSIARAGGRVSGRWLLLLLTFLLPFALMVAAARGAYAIDLLQIPWMLLERIGITAQAAPADQTAVFWHLRLPRVVLAALIGAALAMTGACLQALFRNPLADPALVGVSSGAAVAVAGLIVLGNLVWSSTGSNELLQPLVAFIGAVVAAVVVYRIGCTSQGVSVAAMLLAGIAINALALALIGLASFIATDEQLRNLTFWSLGSLSAASWSVVGTVAVGVVPALLIMLKLIPGLNALALGEVEAHHLGVNVEALKRWAILACALAVGASVAFCGIIGFIGLVAPHMIRLLAGPDARWVLPGAALLGASLDPYYQHLVCKVIREFATQPHCGVVMTMHDMNLASQYADRVIALHKGQKIADGAVEEVLDGELIRNCFEVDTGRWDHRNRGLLATLPL